MNFNNINSADLPNVVYLSLLLALLVSGVIFRSHLKASEILKQLLWWAVIFLIVLIGYSFRNSLSNIKNQVSADLFPSKIVKISERQIAISASNDGHFYINLSLNGKIVRFMVDTGASDMVLSLSDAKMVGIDVDNLKSFRRYQTANGPITSGLTVIDIVEVAGVEFYNITASVNNSNMNTSLLGVGFLRKFAKYEFNQDRLILTYPNTSNK